MKTKEALAVFGFRYQTELAQLLNVTQATVSAWKGEVPFLRVCQIKCITASLQGERIDNDD